MHKVYSFNMPATTTSTTVGRTLTTTTEAATPTMTATAGSFCRHEKASLVAKQARTNPTNKM